MFAFLLIICTPSPSITLQCLLPQTYKTLAVCQHVAKAYKRAAEGVHEYSGIRISARCVQVPK